MEKITQLPKEQEIRMKLTKHCNISSLERFILNNQPRDEHEAERFRKQLLNVCEDYENRIGSDAVGKEEAWISVKDKPKTNGYYLAVKRGYLAFVCSWDSEYWRDFEGDIVNPTHWMPLPSSPYLFKHKNKKG